MESSSPQPNPIILQKPPGYRDPNTQQNHLPPRKPPLPPSFQPKPKKRHCCRICCCTCCIIILILIFLFIIAFALIYILYQPSLPTFHLGSFRVPNFNITANDEGAYLDANTISMVEVKNRNTKIMWHFGQSSVQIWADNGDLNLGSTKIAAFDLKTKNMTALKVETTVKDEILDERQRRKLKSVFDSKALMPSVEVRTRTGVMVQGWKSMMISVTIVCSDATLRQIQNGDMPLCSATVFKWIKFR